MTRTLPFLLPYTVPLSILLCSVRGGPWAFGVVAWIYLAVPWLDVLLGRPPGVPMPDAPPAPGPGALARWALRLWAPTQAALVLWALVVLKTRSASLVDCWVLACDLGLAGGVIGITVAHELCHSRSPWDRRLAELLMLASSYPHFCIQHVHGHHRNVATPGDPATARAGESLYAFLCRCVPGGVRGAWRLEARRLRMRRSPVWSVRNRMFGYATILAAVYALVAWGFGPRGVFFFAAQGAVAVFLLEAINYVQHYGLTRRQVVRGRYEPVRPWHAWNFSHRLSNWLLFNLGRHSDHHCRARLPFHALRDRPEAPQLPAGYFAMVLLALFPPLWQAVMDPRVRSWRQRYGHDAALSPTEPGCARE
jgi:alkane 1-monooxygenase